MGSTGSAPPTASDMLLASHGMPGLFTPSPHLHALGPPQPGRSQGRAGQSFAIVICVLRSRCHRSGHGVACSHRDIFVPCNTPAHQVVPPTKSFWNVFVKRSAGGVSFPKCMSNMRNNFVLEIGGSVCFQIVRRTPPKKILNMELFDLCAF